MLFRPDQRPRSVFPREFSADFVGSIMTCNSVLEIIRMADVKPVASILEQYRRKTFRLAPAVGFEPTTNRLTADRSTTELRWINTYLSESYNDLAYRLIFAWSPSYDTL